MKDRIIVPFLLTSMWGAMKTPVKRERIEVKIRPPGKDKLKRRRRNKMARLDRRKRR